MTIRPIRFGIVARTASSSKDWIEKVRRLENLGFDVLYVPDHITGDRLGPLIALTSAAGATNRIRLSNLVLANDFRHPLMLAKEAASVDIISDGRFELGLGAGWMAADYEMSGLAYDAPMTRIERLSESLAIIKAAWSGEVESFKGKYYTTDEVFQRPLPVQRPRPPILLGGAAPKMLRLAAREADIVNVTMRTSLDGTGVVESDVGREQFLRKLDIIRDEAGDRWSSLTLSVSVQALAIDTPVNADIARNEYSRDYLERLSQTPFVLQGSVAGIIEEVLQWNAEYGISDFVIHDEADANHAALIINGMR